jgi:hypothetical protein
VSTSNAAKVGYAGYWAALPRAEHAANTAQRTQILTPYATEPLLGQVLTNIDNMHAKNVTTTGSVTVHIEKVEVTGDQAHLWDCQDSRNAFLKNSITGKITSRGVPNDYLEATLVRGADAQWRVSMISPLGRC